jgi:diguanylate cyclase (GGDEF)-like protein
MLGISPASAAPASALAAGTAQAAIHLRFPHLIRIAIVDRRPRARITRPRDVRSEFDVSFGRRLAGYFIVLALVPLTAGFLGFAAVIERSELRQLDLGLQAGLRAALASYESELTSAESVGEKLARSPAFQRALVSRDRAALRRLLSGEVSLRLQAGKLRIGKKPPLAGQRQIDIVGPHGTLGTLFVDLPLTTASLRRLEQRAGIAEGEQLALLQNGTVVAGGPALGFTLSPGARDLATVNGDHERYRVVSATSSTLPRSLRLALFGNQHVADQAAARVEHRLLALLIGLLGLIGVIALIEGRAMVRAVRGLTDAARGFAQGRLEQRVSVRSHDEFGELGRAFNEMAAQLQARLDELARERTRLREATLRFGEGLRASHDVDELLRVVVESAVEATHAAGGIVIGPNGERHAAGNPEHGGERLEWPLRAGRQQFGTLTLLGDDFGPEELETAALLCGNAAVALDNARLHRIVERQARVDGLTGLANRRRCDAALDDEVARAMRLRSKLTLVILDIDLFKAVNDRYGHPAGDLVLQETARVLAESVREIDTAGRWGGEEFALVLPGTDLAGGARLAERIRMALERRRIVLEDGSVISVTASFGVASLPEQAAGREQLVAAADQALYAAKRSGRNRVVTASRRFAAPTGGPPS